LSHQQLYIRLCRRQFTKEAKGLVKNWMIFPECCLQLPYPILQCLKMNKFRRIVIFPAILVLLLALVLIPPVLTGFLNLSQAEGLASTDPGRAALKYETASKLLPWRGDLLEQAGLMALAGENPELALKYFEDSPGLTPIGRLAMGDAYYRLGEVESALELWEGLRTDGFGSAQLYNRLGHVYYQQGRYEEAGEAFSIATSLDDLDADSHYMLGLLLAAQSPKDALTPLIRAGQLDPSLDPVMQVMRRGLNIALLSPGKAAQLTGAGRTLIAVGAWSLAREAFVNAIEADTKYAPAWAWLGQVKQVFQEGGLSELDQALELDPKSAEIRGLRGVYFLRENLFDEARVEFEVAAGLEPVNPDWQVALGDAIARTGDVPLGLGHYQAAIKLSPRKADYWRALANFTVDYNYNVNEIGFPAALQARALAPDDNQNNITLGRVYFALGDLDVARELWEDVLKSIPETPAAHLYLGVLFLQQGNSKSAYENLVQAVNLDPGGPYGSQAGRMLDQYFP
jgi:tetratricopeptide (TPR) repeat protein